MVMKFWVAGLVWLFLSWAAAGGEVWLLSVEGEIGSGTVSYLRKGLSEAAESGAQAAIIRLSTPGGYLDAAISCRDAVLDSQLPTIAYVDREAYSAGALLAIACERIYFAPGGVMGAATPVYFDQYGRLEEAPEKTISAVRALFRATAELRGRDPQVAEAMVDRSVEIPGLVQAGKLLTLTAELAWEWGYSEGEAPTLDRLLEAAGLAGAEVVPFHYRWVDRAVGLLTRPEIAGLMILIALVGLIWEMLIPGFGLPGTVGLAALAAFLWAHFMVGLAGWESILFLLGGMVAIVLEVFVFTATDFGLAGLVGLVLIGLGFYTSMVGPFTEAGQVISAIVSVSLALLVAIVGSFVLVARLPRTRLRLGGVVLQHAITSRVTDRGGLRRENHWVGRRGVAVTDLRPVGAGEFSGERLDVICEEGFLPKGTPIEIVRDEGFRKVVRQIREVKR
jgi:membrane-bound serine protease (ClpP class)